MADAAPTRSPEFLIENILPSGEVHLLGGPSGAGKTTWLFQILKDQWKPEGKILGHLVHPVPFMYVAADRSKKGVERTMKRAGVTPGSIPFISLVDYPNIASPVDLANAILEQHPDTKLIFIDGVMRLMPTRRDSATDGGFAHVSKFLIALCKLCVEKDLTIVLIVHSPKQKEDSRYTNPRERVMGSAAWAAFTETVILVEPFLPVSRETADCRTMICLPRNSAAIFLDLEFNVDGRLVERSEGLDTILIEQFLGKVTAGGTFTTDQFESALARSMARSTIFMWLKRLESQGTITKISRGVYRRNLPC
jgi:AAA domain